MRDLSLYAQALGANYETLPPAVQRFHRLAGRTVLHGWVQTRAPASWLAKGLAFLLGTPRSSTEGPLRFELNAGPERETWTRHFPTQTMRSQFRLADGQVEEQFGVVRLSFTLTASQCRLSLKLASVRCLGVQCPKWLLPKVEAEETGSENRLHFEVSAVLPWVGMVAGYRGHLELPPKAMHSEKSPAEAGLGLAAAGPCGPAGIRV